MGVWSAYQPCTQVLALDTEGMLGMAQGQGGENGRTRQLLKVLAVSDVVLYKTRYVS